MIMSQENLEQFTRSSIRARFSEYYRRSENIVISPQSMEQREFGFLLFAEGLMVRHRSFKQAGDLRRFIENTVPSDVYYSAAYYREPEAPMDKKAWTGSDLIFDIDADHIDTDCKEEHDKWLCVQCKTSGYGRIPKNCPKCKGQKLDAETWMCHDCLERAKEEVLKLANLLNADFGLGFDQMSANFSGHRGYHLHVFSEEVRKLGSEERKEIVNYIIGTGLDTDLLDIYDSYGKLKIVGAPRPSDPGWRGRTARQIEKILSEANREELKRLGLRNDMIESIMRLRNEGHRGREPIWGAIKGAGRQTWKAIIQRATSLESVGIDTVVTTDIHRLIRLPETLNGKTGFRAVRVEMDHLQSFNPLKQALAFEGYETVHIRDAPKFTIGEKEYGPFNDVDETLPTAAAILLLCKGRAYPVAN